MSVLPHGKVRRSVRQELAGGLAPEGGRLHGWQALGPITRPLAAGFAAQQQPERTVDPFAGAVLPEGARGRRHERCSRQKMYRGRKYVVTEKGADKRRFAVAGFTDDEVVRHSAVFRGVEEPFEPAENSRGGGVLDLIGSLDESHAVLVNPRKHVTELWRYVLVVELCTKSQSGALAQAGSGGRCVGNTEFFSDDVDFAFVAGDSLPDSDDQSAKFGYVTGGALEALVLSVKA